MFAGILTACTCRITPEKVISGLLAPGSEGEAPDLYMPFDKELFL